MKLRPLPGWVLLELVPEQKVSSGGILFPDRSESPEERQIAARDPKPPGPLTAIVREIGPWPKTKKGLALLPEFQKNSKVLIPFHAGIEMQKNVGDRFRMVRYDQVLGIVEDDDLSWKTVRTRSDEIASALS